MGITPPQVARVVELVKEGKLTTKVARQAVDDALAAHPDIVGVVMKATQGKADPGQVNKLIAKKLS